MVAGAHSEDFVVVYRAKSPLTGRDVFLASDSYPFAITERRALAMRFGRSMADQVSASFPDHEATHHRAEVLQVPRASPLIDD